MTESTHGGRREGARKARPLNKHRWASYFDYALNRYRLYCLVCGATKESDA
jgi:hypothetical protein